MNARNPYLWFSVIGLIVLVIAALAIIPNLSGGAQATPTSSPTSIPATAVLLASPTNSPSNTSTALPSATATSRASATPRSTATSTLTPTPTKRATQAAASTQTAQPQATAQPSSTAIPPTAQPTEQPTEQPTNPPPTATTAPSATPLPTTPPTVQPTEAPTEAPTQSPTESPTESPTTLAAGFVSASSPSSGMGGRVSGLEATEAEFVSTAQSSNETGERESEADWMAQLWRWTGPVVVALLISVGMLLWLAELAPARRWRLASVITRITAKPSPQPSPDESR